MAITLRKAREMPHYGRKFFMVKPFVAGSRFIPGLEPVLDEPALDQERGP
jgi:hypothetical protein